MSAFDELQLYRANDEYVEEDVEEESSSKPSEKDEDNEESQQVHRFRVRRTVADRRLDSFLRGRYPRISRTLLQKYIKDGQVTVNGLPTKPSYEPRTGDWVQLILPPPPPSEVVPQDIPIDIIYEDEWLLAINKSPSIVCHPAHASQSGTIANAVAFHAKTLSRGEDPFRPGILHRLDKNTTGVLLIAKTDEAHWRVSLQFERRTVKKEYFAICEGKFALDGDVINRALAPHPDTTQRMVLQNHNVPRQAMFKEAITEYRVLERFRGFTTVQLLPRTGRTHQLRVHMSSIGHSIVGDMLYGGHPISEHDLDGSGSIEALINYQALHARRLSLVHPIRETPLVIEAPLPDRLNRIVELLKKHRQLI